MMFFLMRSSRAFLIVTFRICGKGLSVSSFSSWKGLVKVQTTFLVGLEDRRDVELDYFGRIVAKKFTGTSCVARV